MHMSYEQEYVSQIAWEQLRDSYAADLSAISISPEKRAIDRSTGNFLVEVRNDDDRGEKFRSCLQVSGGRSTQASFSNGRKMGTWDVLWTAWSGIEEQDIALLNAELVEGVATLYGLRKEVIGRCQLS